MHASSEGQSAFMTHSGLQLGGEPIISGRQEQRHWPPMSLGGLLFGPQGLGSHGSDTTGANAKIILKIYIVFVQYSNLIIHVIFLS